MLPELRVAAQPDHGVLARREIVARLEDIHGHRGEELRHLLPPDRDDARRADNEARPILRGPGREKGQDLERLAKAHFVGEEPVAVHLAEVVHPFDAAPLVRAQDLRQLRGGVRGSQDLLAPGLHLGRERELEARVVEKGEHQVLQLGRAALLRLLDILAPGAVRLPPFRREGDDAEVGQDDRLAPSPEQRRDLGVRQHPLPGPEDPAQVEARVTGGALGHGLDLDAPGPLQQVGGTVVELDGEHPLPERQRHLEEIRDLHQGLHQVDARLLIVLEMGLARVGGQADQLRALARRDMPVSVGSGVGPVPQRGMPRLLVRIHPEGLEGEPRGPDLEDEQEGARGAVEARDRGAAGPPVHRPLAVGRCRSAVGDGGPRGAGLRGKRRYLVGHQLLDLVKSCHRKRMRNFPVRRRRPDRKPPGVPLDDRVFVLLLDPAVDDGVAVRQLQLPDLPVPVDPSALVQLARGECLRPIVGKHVEPVFKRMWCVDPFRTVGLHLPKRLKVESRTFAAQQLFQYVKYC